MVCQIGGQYLLSCADPSVPRFGTNDLCHLRYTRIRLEFDMLGLQDSWLIKEGRERCRHLLDTICQISEAE